MEFSKCVKERRSIRRYKQESIPHEKFEEIVSLASFSPSWKNSQIVRYTLVENKDIKQQLAKECTMGFKFNSDTIENAPAIVVVTMVEKRSGYEQDGSFTTTKQDRWEMFDAGIATQTFCLAAHSKGLGTVILGVFDEQKIATTIDLPQNQKVAAMIAIGFALGDVAAPKRKQTAELMTYIV